MKNLDYRLYLIADYASVPKTTFFSVVEKGLKGGVTIVQFRNKTSSTKEFVDLGLKLRKLTRKYRVPLIVNDRIDVAISIDADGVHLGQDDMPIELARKILGL